VPQDGIYLPGFLGQFSNVSTAQLTKQSRPLSSVLLEKARQLGLLLPLDLERLAIMRGCEYYNRDLEPRVPPLVEVPFTNAELAVALISPALHPGARQIRLTAALLGASDVNPPEVSALAMRENCGDVVRHIALSGLRFEPGNSFWQTLLDLLPEVQISSDRFPHPSRFVEMTGIDRGKVGLITRWIRPRGAGSK